MKARKRRAGPLIPVIAFLLSAGCGGGAKEIPRPDVTQNPKPAWVEKGSGAFGGSMEKAFYGVGSAWGLQDPSLLRSTADKRARAEVARVFRAYTAALLKDDRASTPAGDTEEMGEEQYLEQTVKTFTAAELDRVQIVDRWKDPETEEFFALARMDLGTFEEYLKQGAGLGEAARQTVVERAGKAFQDLAEEAARHE